jgi:hypothetical protein
VPVSGRGHRPLTAYKSVQAVSIATTGFFAIATASHWFSKLLLTSPNHEHQGAREGRQHRLRRDAEEVSVECHIDQRTGQEQPGGTDACDLAGRH